VSHLDFIAASLSPWSTREGGLCNIKSELLRWGPFLCCSLDPYWFEAWICDQRAKLLFAGCSSLATITGCRRLLQNRWWVACHGKSELLTALLPCSATITHDSVSCLCSIMSHGLVSPLDVSFWNLVGLTFLVHKFFYVS